MKQCDRDAALFERVSLAGNDGVQLFIVERSQRKLRAHAERYLEALGAATFAETKLEAAPPLDAAVAVDGSGANQEPRIVAATAADYVFMIATTSAQAPEALVAELALAAQTLTSERRPWWRFW